MPNCSVRTPCVVSLNVNALSRQEIEWHSWKVSNLFTSKAISPADYLAIHHLCLFKCFIFVHLWPIYPSSQHCNYSFTHPSILIYHVRNCISREHSLAELSISGLTVTSQVPKLFAVSIQSALVWLFYQIFCLRLSASVCSVASYLPTAASIV